MTDRKTNEEFADTFSKFVNSYSTEPKKVAEILLRVHRTLQQGVMRFCVAYIEGMSENHFDLRNQASVEFAKKVMENTDSADRAMPFI